jgi:hypothetical protein
VEFAVTIPSRETVFAAAADFERENEVVEAALRTLFDAYPKNDKLPEILLKVAAVNCFYSTQIRLYSLLTPTLQEMAESIHAQSPEIDLLLEAGSTKVVERIGSISPGGKALRHNYSFATKYWSWQRPASFPIWDSRVEVYLRSLRKHPGFDWVFGNVSELWSYAEFRNVIDRIKERCGLADVSYKKFDEFLYQEGSKLFDQQTVKKTSSL